MSFLRKKKNFIIVVSVLVLVELASVFLMYKSSTGGTTKLEDVRLRDSSNSIKSGLAIMLEQSDGSYSESENTSWPTTGYSYNSDKSGCIDENGNEVSDALTYDSATNLVNVRTQGSTYCYLYFDYVYSLSELCSSGDNLGSCLTTNNSEIDSLNDNVEGGLYRYQGTQTQVNNNYICFGTTDSSECTSNTDAYMYRIIGVNETGQLKLIKKEALNTAYAWNSSTGVTWAESEIYNGINGDYYLSNSTYMPSGWKNKVSNTTWKYGDITTYNTTADSVYTTENGWSSTVSNYIGLMYMHDYYYAYQSGGLNCSSSGDWGTCKTAWLHLSVNDSGAPSTAEWTMSRYSSNIAWAAGSNGYVYYPNMTITNSVRPVFYLNADEVYMSGDGTIDNPIMLSEPEMPLAGETILAQAPSGLNTTMEGGLYRFQGTSPNNYICFGTSTKSTCTGNTDQYMYRIIGINSSGQLKLIKKEALNSTMTWNSSTGVTWTNSGAYSSLNGSTFYTNTTYVPTSWQSKIAETSWKYGDITTDNTTADSVYTTENGWTSTTSAKIGLMYMHDYYYAYQSGGLNCSSSGDYATCKTAWLHLSVNDSGAPSAAEWTLSRASLSIAWCVASGGRVDDGSMTYAYSVRPVFYLTSDVQFVGGTGTSSDPFIVE